MSQIEWQRVAGPLLQALVGQRLKRRERYTADVHDPQWRSEETVSIETCSRNGNRPSAFWCLEGTSPLADDTGRLHVSEFLRLAEVDPQG
jgi:hypothetical protein